MQVDCDSKRPSNSTETTSEHVGLPCRGRPLQRVPWSPKKRPRRKTMISAHNQEINADSYSVRYTIRGHKGPPRMPRKPLYLTVALEGKSVALRHGKGMLSVFDRLMGLAFRGPGLPFSGLSIPGQHLSFIFLSFCEAPLATNAHLPDAVCCAVAVCS